MHCRVLCCPPRGEGHRECTIQDMIVGRCGFVVGRGVERYSQTEMKLEGPTECTGMYRCFSVG